jgi:hypothetical protein
MRIEESKYLDCLKEVSRPSITSNSFSMLILLSKILIVSNDLFPKEKEKSM